MSAVTPDTMPETYSAYTNDTISMVDISTTLYNDSNINIDNNDSSLIEMFTTDTHRLITHNDSVTSVLREGLYAEKRPITPAENPWVVGLLIFSFAFFAISYRQGYKYLRHLFISLFKVNSRGNLFDETTINENQLRLSLLLLTFTTEGIALYHSLIAPILTNSNLILLSIAVCVAICGVYYLLQLCVYRLLGNIFSSRQQTDSFLENFTSVNIFIGLFFIPFILLMLFVPAMSRIAIFLCLILYTLARLIIIYKGVRFFLPHIYKLHYLILYLCALEIIPILLIRKLVVFIYKLFSLNIITN